MMWYCLKVESEKARFPKTLEALGFEYYEADNGFTFESEYFCDIEEKADCLIEMNIDFQFIIAYDYGDYSTRNVHDKDIYLLYKEDYNEEV